MRKVFGFTLKEDGTPTRLPGTVLTVKFVLHSGVVAYCETDDECLFHDYQIFDITRAVSGEFQHAFEGRDGRIRLLYRLDTGPFMR